MVSYLGDVGGSACKLPQSRMKIFQSLAQLESNSGGPARSVPQLSLELVKRGHQVGLWAPEKLVGPLADITAEEGEVLKIYSGSFSAALDSFGDTEIVHDHGVWLPCHREVAQICGERCIPRIVSPRGMLEPWALNHKKWKKRLAWHLYQRKNLQVVAGLHATADQEGKNLRGLGLESPLIIAPNGVNLPEIKRWEYGAESQVKTALFLSRIHPIKGLPILLKAWESIRPQGWKMRIVGPDEEGHLKELKKQVDAAGLSREWCFEGPLEGAAKFQAMVEADLFILPSYSENFGIVVAEALATQTPVITTTGTPWEGLLKNECGWWVEPKVGPLAEALEKALRKSDQERSDMGRRGQDWVKKDFAWPAIAKKVEAFYQEVIR